jgi:hypothetical protein
MAILPATGSAITFGRVKKGHSNVAAAGGQNISLRATLGPYKSITTGAVSLSSVFGGKTTPYADL